MNGVATSFVVLNSFAIALLPRRLMLLPLLVGTCYLPFYLGIQIGPFHFTAIRILVAFGLGRALLRGEWPRNGIGYVDRALLLWLAWMLITSIFHDPTFSPFVFRLGMAYDAFGIYLLVRCACQSMDDVYAVCKVIPIVLVPLAAEMIYEQLAVRNLFAVFGGVGDTPIIREGRIRANGPFAHPILAGTVGAACLPLAVGLWLQSRKWAITGLIATCVIVLGSASSGPVLSAMAGVFALALWRYRRKVKYFQVGALLAYVALEIIMKDPAYFIIARVDLAGGSTSWYRARLIQSAFEHISEWWFAGTDYTRNWMWVVVNWSPNHTDITSHYIQLGVWGGLPLIFLYIFLLLRAFGVVSRMTMQKTVAPLESKFLVWCFGASLFALAVSGFSVNYFDQSIVFLYVLLGVLGSVERISPDNSMAHIQSQPVQKSTKRYRFSKRAS